MVSSKEYLYYALLYYVLGTFGFVVLLGLGYGTGALVYGICSTIPICFCLIKAADQ